MGASNLNLSQHVLAERDVHQCINASTPARQQHSAMRAAMGSTIPPRYQGGGTAPTSSSKHLRGTVG